MARVAMIQNQPQDVVVVATAALELQPDNLAAAEILVRVESVACSVGEGEAAPQPHPRH